MDNTDFSPSGHTTTNPETRAGDPFAYAGERPHGCYAGWIYLGVEGEDPDDERVERVPCRRCEREDG